MMKATWTKLDRKQRYLVAICAAVVAIALLMEFAVFPMWDAKAKMKKSILNHSMNLQFGNLK